MYCVCVYLAADFPVAIVFDGESQGIGTVFFCCPLHVGKGDNQSALHNCWVSPTFFHTRN